MRKLLAAVALGAASLVITAPEAQASPVTVPTTGLQFDVHVGIGFHGGYRRVRRYRRYYRPHYVTRRRVVYETPAPVVHHPAPVTYHSYSYPSYGYSYPSYSYSYPRYSYSYSYRRPVYRPSLYVGFSSHGHRHVHGHRHYRSSHRSSRRVVGRRR